MPVSSFPRRRVVITGVGVVSPLGLSLAELATAMAEGRSGIRRFEPGEASGVVRPYGALVANFAGQIDDFGPLEGDLKKAIRKGLKVMCRESQMGVAAAQRALADSGLTAGELEPERSGVSFGSDYMLTEPQDFSDSVVRCRDPDMGEFDYARWASEGMRAMTPLWLLKYLPNMPASHLAIYNDLRGPNNSLTLREASSNLAVGEAFHIVAEGRADRMLAGATGTRLHPMKSVHAAMQEELAPADLDPARAARPFDRDRAGLVLGEGAGAVVLETLDAAQARGARIHGEIVAAASSAVAGPRLVAARSKALANVLRAVLRYAAMSPDQVGHLNAHAAGTRSGDAEEASAIRQVFVDRAARVPVVAYKSYFGHLGAGGGMVELAASLAALGSGRLFGTLNYDTPDPDCPVAVSRESGEPAGQSFISLSVTPQGQASALLVRAV